MESDESMAAFEAAMEGWKEELGFQQGEVRVRRFVLPELGLGIEDRLDYFEDMLRSPEWFADDEAGQEENYRFIREWDETGCFVLHWGNDLWVDGNGEGTSS
jgi:hypothetical protein